jgi:hypothetical protein
MNTQLTATLAKETYINKVLSAMNRQNALCAYN